VGAKVKIIGNYGIGSIGTKASIPIALIYYNTVK
jgi:hypothetical protein